MEFITHEESAELSRLEKVVERGKKAFIEVGNALKEIRDGKLYRASHRTFAAYVEDRFEFKRDYAYKLIETSKAAGNVSNCIQNEGQAREVAKAPAEKQSEVVERAHEIAEETGKPVTAKVMAEARKEVMGELVDDDPPPSPPNTTVHTPSEDDEYEDFDPPEEPNRIGELLEMIQQDFQPFEWRIVGERLIELSQAEPTQ